MCLFLQIYFSFIMQSFVVVFVLQFNLHNSLKTETIYGGFWWACFLSLFFISWNAALLNTESAACTQVPFLDFDADVLTTNSYEGIFLSRFQDVGFKLRLITRLQAYVVVVFPSIKLLWLLRQWSDIFIVAVSVVSDNLWASECMGDLS